MLPIPQNTLSYPDDNVNKRLDAPPEDPLGRLDGSLGLLCFAMF